MKRVFTFLLALVMVIPMGLTASASNIERAFFDSARVEYNIAEQPDYANAPYYRVVDKINARYGTNFKISAFEDIITLTPAEFELYMENLATIATSTETPTIVEVSLPRPSARASGPYYDVVPVRINSFFDMNVEVAYKIADNGNDLYFIQNTSDDRYTFSSTSTLTWGYVEVDSYRDYVSSDKLKVFIDLVADCYISSGGIVILADQVDDTFQIHINSVA